MNSLRLSANLRTIIPALLFVAAASGYGFQPGDQVKLTRDEPLYFRDQKFREGKVGERFTVLAERPDHKTVFLSATDSSGRQIALSVPGEALAPIPVDSAEARSRAIIAIRSNSFDEAQRLLDAAIRSSPAESGLRQLSDALPQIRAARQQLAAAEQNLRRASQEAAGLRKNAAVADRPNPLNAKDNSGQERAGQMRAQADRLEEEGRRTVEDASTRLQQALLAAGVSADASNTTIPALASNKGLVGPAPSASSIQSSSRSVGELHAAPAPASPTNLAAQSLRRYSDDPAVMPPQFSDGQWQPSYPETLEFINGMIAGRNQKMWFGKNTGKMILESNVDLLIFDPASLSPEVKFTREPDENGTHRGGNGVHEWPSRDSVVLKIHRTDEKRQRTNSAYRRQPRSRQAREGMRSPDRNVRRQARRLLDLQHVSIPSAERETVSIRLSKPVASRARAPKSGSAGSFISTT